MVAKDTLRFLSALKKNNNKDWFDRNKEKYLAAKADIDKLTGEIIQSFSKFEPAFKSLTPKDCVFRIYRDVRFSKDKRPYKTNMGLSMNAGGKKAETAGYYVHIEPGNSFFAAGRWMPSSDHLKKIRQEIDFNGRTLNRILKNTSFKKKFGTLSDEYKLSRPPKGYNEDHPLIDLLKLTSFIAWKKIPDRELTGKSLVKQLDSDAKIIKPLIDFLNEAID